MCNQDVRAASPLSPEVFAELVEGAPVGVCVVQDERVVYANRWLRQFGWVCASGPEPLSAPGVFHPEDRPQFLELLRLTLAGGPAAPGRAVRLLRRDGMEHAVEVHASRISRAGRPATQVTFIDSGARTEVENLRRSRRSLEREVAERTAALEATNQELRREIEQRRRSEERLLLFAAAIEGAAEGFYLIGLDGRIIYVNRAVEALSGVPPEGYIGKPIGSLHTDPGVPARVIMPAVQRDGSWAGEVTGRKSDGSQITLWLTASLVRDESGRPIAMVGITKDLSAQRRLEEEHIKAQKLESIGVLAGGLAHDFNNLLTIILGNLDLARMFCNGSTDMVEPLDHAAEAAMRAGDLTRQLIMFSKGGRPDKRTGNLAQSVRETVVFAATGSTVACEFELPDNLPLVEFDEGQMRQVIHNLVQNAREAMPEGGTLRVSAGAVLLREGEVPALPPGRYLRLTFADKGSGISGENLNRIFDPYFSTKEMDAVKGRGLGLAVSYSIIRNHGGAIVADSRVGGGTTIVVYLPETQHPAQETDAADEDPEFSEASKTDPEQLSEAPLDEIDDGPRGPSRGRVLVMDDEPLVLGMARSFLVRLGYDVTLCRSGEEAVVQYQIGLDSNRRFFAVILDLTVPGGLGGPDVLARLLQIDPRVRAVLSSGYSEHPAVQNWAHSGFAAFIAKPYSLKEFEGVLERLT